MYAKVGFVTCGHHFSFIRGVWDVYMKRGYTVQRWWPSTDTLR